MLGLTGLKEEFTIAKNPLQKVSMENWNPFLVAIAFKRLDIIRYFMMELKVSVKVACRDPHQTFENVPSTREEEVKQEYFGLHLAIINKDQSML